MRNPVSKPHGVRIPKQISYKTQNRWKSNDTKYSVVPQVPQVRRTLLIVRWGCTNVSLFLILARLRAAVFFCPQTL